MQVARKPGRMDRMCKYVRHFVLAPRDFEQAKLLLSYVRLQDVQIKMDRVAWSDGV